MEENKKQKENNDIKFEELKLREDLMVDFDTLSKEIDEYFENINKKTLIKDLKEIGIAVKKDDQQKREE